MSADDASAMTAEKARSDLIELLARITDMTSDYEEAVKAATKDDIGLVMSATVDFHKGMESVDDGLDAVEDWICDQGSVYCSTLESSFRAIEESALDLDGPGALKALTLMMEMMIAVVDKIETETGA